MQYMLLIYSDPTKNPEPGSSAFGEYIQAYGAFTEEIKKSGHFKAGDGLQAVTTATTVRVRGGKSETTDGPFAETKEVLGGYYLVEAKDLDEAMGIAARIPTAAFGSIEVRPVMIYS